TWAGDGEARRQGVQGVVRNFVETAFSLASQCFSCHAVIPTEWLQPRAKGPASTFALPFTQTAASTLSPADRAPETFRGSALPRRRSRCAPHPPSWRANLSPSNLPRGTALARD